MARPTLILHGEEDFLVSVQQANLLSESLEAAKKPYRFVRYPNSGHYLPSEDVRRTVTAFQRSLRISLPCSRQLIFSDKLIRHL